MQTHTKISVIDRHDFAAKALVKPGNQFENLHDDIPSKSIDEVKCSHSMPPAVTKPPATQRKRNRKRKRRAASTSSSSDPSSSSSSEDEAPKTTTKIVPIVPSLSQPRLESDSSSDSESSSDDTTAEIQRGRQANNVTPKTPRQFSPSPSPPSAALPSFLPSESTEDDLGSKEKELQIRFRQFWMSSVADGFKEDLEAIRKVSRNFRLKKLHTMLLTFHNSFFKRNLTLEPRA
jgi:ribosome assembly protein 3